MLNYYFCTIADLQDDDVSLQNFDDRGTDTLSDITDVSHDIIDIISLLDLNKAVGPDRISNKILREVKYEIAGPLYLPFNKSLRENSGWKLAHIISIYIYV